MRRSTTLLAILTLILASLGFCQRYQLAAKMWHWRHGDSVRVGRYRIPVPDNWYARNEGNETLLIDTSAPGLISGKRTMSANVHVSTLPVPIADLDHWKSQRENTLHSAGLAKIEDYNVAPDGETIVCLGGNVMNDVVKIDSAKVWSVECRSRGNLALVFIGRREELTNFYALLSKIRHE